MQKKTITPAKRANYYNWALQAFIVGSILFLLYNSIFKNEKIAYVNAEKLLKLV